MMGRVAKRQGVHLCEGELAKGLFTMMSSLIASIGLLAHLPYLC